MKKILLLSTAMFLLSIAIFAQEPDGRKYFFIRYYKYYNENIKEFECVTNVFYIEKEDCNEHFIKLEFDAFLKDYYVKEGLKTVKEMGYYSIYREWTKEKAEEERRDVIKVIKETMEIIERKFPESRPPDITYINDFKPTCNRIKLNER